MGSRGSRPADQGLIGTLGGLAGRYKIYYGKWGYLLPRVYCKTLRSIPISPLHEGVSNIERTHGESSNKIRSYLGIPSIHPWVSSFWGLSFVPRAVSSSCPPLCPKGRSSREVLVFNLGCFSQHPSHCQPMERQCLGCLAIHLLRSPICE